MTDGSGDWTYRGRFGADDFGAGDFGADDPRPDDDFYAELDRQGYGRPGLTERPGDPYHQPRSGDSGRYGQPGGYDGEVDGYGRPSSHGPAGGYGRYSQPSNDDDLADFGAGPDGQGPYGQDPYGQDPYGAGSPYPDAAYPPGEELGRGGYEASGSFGQYGDDPYGDQDSYQPDPGRTSSYEWPGQRPPGDSPATQQYGRAASAGADNGYGGGSYGDTGSFGRAASGSYGDTGSFGRADSGSYGDTGSFGRADSDSFGRGATGSFGRGDSGSFGRPGSDSFDHDRIGRGQALPPSRGALPAGSDGYAQWHSDPMERAGWDDDGDHDDSGDDDWADDDDNGGPVSRFFGRGGRGGAERDDDERGDRGPRRLRGRLAMVVAILVGALVLGMGADFGYEYAHTWINTRYGDYSGDGYGTVHVTVPPGSSLTGLGPTLLSDNVIMALRPYDSAANATQAASGLQPGVYLLHKHMNAAKAVAALLNPKNRAKDQITIIEGWRASQIAAALAKQTGLPAGQFTQIIDHPTAALGLPKWAPAGRSAEGFLFPDTYTLLPHESPLKILKMMVQDFSRRAASVHLPAVALQKFTTAYHVLIVASLIQAEAGSVGDFKKISRVIWDRLKNSMELQFDSTVFYAMGKYGTAITKAEETYPSPYNTYAHLGLPPGPIGSPSLLAIEAALHPTEGQTWLYFITDTRHKPFKTYFTSSLTQLQRWQQQFQG